MEPRRADEAVPEEDERTRKERLKDFAQDKTPKKLKNPTNFQVRFRTGFVYIVVSVVCVLASEWTTLALLVAMAGITAGEFYYMLRQDAKLPNEMLGIIAAMLYPVSVFFLGLDGALYADVRTGEVTRAIKDAKDAHDNPIREGDVIGIADGSIEAVDDSIDGAVLTLLGKMDAEDADTCTILAGEGYSDEDLEALVAKIEEAYDELEVDAQRGEQPLYPIVFSVE